MKQLSLPEFKIRYFLNGIFYLVAIVLSIQLINFIGVATQGLDFLSWWPMGKAMMFGLGGVPDSTLTTHISGLAVELSVPGLNEYYETHWLNQAGLSLLTSVLFLTILGIFRRMIATVDIQKPFDPANIRRVKILLLLLIVEVFGLDYLRTQSMLPVKALIDQGQVSFSHSDSSYQNADAYAYILFLLLLTSLAVFRRGVILHQQQLELEKQIYHKQKLEALGTMASGIGHDFNNIVTSIIGYAEMAKSETDNQDSDFALERVLDSAYRAKRLTQQIRAMGGKHNDSTHEEMIDLNEQVEELLLSIAPSIPCNICVIKKFSTDERFEMCADPIKIYQLLLNLCTNALQAMEGKSGHLSIDIYSQSRFDRAGFCITIEDTGPGITSAHQQQIFDPYFTTRKPKGGTGLGLSLCHSIVESYGGNISVQSELGQGSRFEVWLPRVNPTSEWNSDLQPVRQQNKILLIGNELSTMNLIKRKLTGYGHIVEAYSDHHNALRALTDTQTPFDLVILDCQDSQTDDIKLLKEVEKIAGDIPIIVVTTQPEQLTISASRDAARHVLSKPIAFSELQWAINDSLEN